jgi:Na+/H+ antiporter NhaC
MKTPETPLAFAGGAAGAVAPFLLFLAGVAWLALSGAPDERGFWPVLVAALGVGLLLARDRAAYVDAVVRGMSRPIVALMILAWLLAGMLAALLAASGLLDSLLAGGRALGLQGGAFVAVAFLVASLLSTATGTSLGTLILAVPLLYPLAAPLAASPAWLLGAVLAGATFGDNLSPVSDTTIASAATQGASMGAVVRSRLRYALPAAAGALVLYALFGGGTATAAISTETATASWQGAAMVAVPVLVIGLLLRGANLVAALLGGAAAAAGLGLVLGNFEVADLMHIDRDAYLAKGLLLDGLQRGIGISVFTLLLMGLTGGLEASGLVDRAVAATSRWATSPRRAELWIFGATSLAVLLTTHSVVAMLAVGSFASAIGERQGISRPRRANLLDVTVCTYPFLLPYFIPTILASSLSRAGAEMSLPQVPPWQVGLLNLHSWGLLLVMLFAIGTGWGRREGEANG